MNFRRQRKDISEAEQNRNRKKRRWKKALGKKEQRMGMKSQRKRRTSPVSPGSTNSEGTERLSTDLTSGTLSAIIQGMLQ